MSVHFRVVVSEATEQGHDHDHWYIEAVLPECMGVSEPRCGRIDNAPDKEMRRAVTEAEKNLLKGWPHESQKKN